MKCHTEKREANVLQKHMVDERLLYSACTHSHIHTNMAAFVPASACVPAMYWRDWTRMRFALCVELRSAWLNESRWRARAIVARIFGTAFNGHLTPVHSPTGVPLTIWNCLNQLLIHCFIYLCYEFTKEYSKIVDNVAGQWQISVFQSHRRRVRSKCVPDRISSIDRRGSNALVN